MATWQLAVIEFLALLPAFLCGNGQSVSQTTTKTKIVLLGTGAPAPDPDHSRPATAIVVNDTAYLVDLGPGVVRRASAASARGIAALEPTQLRMAFITHLHSDHTLGYPDMIFTPWTIRRRTPLEVYVQNQAASQAAHCSLVAPDLFAKPERFVPVPTWAVGR